MRPLAATIRPRFVAASFLARCPRRRRAPSGNTRTRTAATPASRWSRHGAGPMGSSDAATRADRVGCEPGRRSRRDRLHWEPQRQLRALRPDGTPYWTGRINSLHGRFLRAPVVGADGSTITYAFSPQTGFSQLARTSRSRDTFATPLVALSCPEFTSVRELRTSPVALGSVGRSIAHARRFLKETRKHWESSGDSCQRAMFIMRSRQRAGISNEHRSIVSTTRRHLSLPRCQRAARC